MIYLSKGFFRPVFSIFFTFLYALTIGCVALTICGFTIARLIVSILFCIASILGTIALYKASKSKKHYLSKENDGSIVIKYPSGSEEMLTLAMSDIVSIEYYRILSLNAFLVLTSGMFPNCAYVNYSMDGKVERKFIGYPKFNELSELCRGLGIKIVLK